MMRNFQERGFGIFERDPLFDRALGVAFQQD